MTARETRSKEVLKSVSIPVTMTIQDTNDNRPLLSQDSYYAFIDNLVKEPRLLPQQVVQFEVSDKDLGVYGVAGLVCFLVGDGSEKLIYCFFLD